MGKRVRKRGIENKVTSLNAAAAAKLAMTAMTHTVAVITGSGILID